MQQVLRIDNGISRIPQIYILTQDPWCNNWGWGWSSSIDFDKDGFDDDDTFEGLSFDDDCRK